MPAQTQRASGFSYGASARVGMPQFSVSDADQAIFNTVARQGLKHWLSASQFDATTQTVADMASGDTWSKLSGATPLTVTNSLLGHPAFVMDAKDKGHLISSADKPAGDFSIAVVYGQSSDNVADTSPRILWSSGPDTDHLVHARWFPGGDDDLTYWQDNANGARVTTDRGAGQTLDIFTFNAATNAASIIGASGAVSATQTFPGDPDSGYQWQVGGWSSDTLYNFQGLIAEAFIFDVDLSGADKARVLRDFTAAVRAKYGL